MTSLSATESPTTEEFISAFFHFSFDVHIQSHILRLVLLPSLTARMTSMISYTSKEFMFVFLYIRNRLTLSVS